MKTKSESKAISKKSVLKDTPESKRLAGVVFEDFSSQMKVFNESLELMGAQITRSLTERIDRLEKHVDDRFLAVDARFYKVEKRIEVVHQELKQDIRELSGKMDLITEKVQVHDVKIKSLQLGL